MTRYAVVIPARNASAFVGEAVASALAQSIPPESVVVVDDGSTDGTGDVARAAGARVIVHPIARGVSAARNSGIATVTSPVIGFLDADDIWTTDHASLCLAALAGEGASVAFGRSMTFMADEDVIWPRIAPGRLRDPIGVLLVDNTVPQSAAFVVKDALEAVGGYDESMALSEDYDLWCRLALRYGFVHTGATTLRRRVHTGQTTWQRAAELRAAAWQVRRKAIMRLRDHERQARYPALVEAMASDRDAAIRVGGRRELREVRALARRMDAELGTGDLLERTACGSDRLRTALITLRVNLRRMVRRVR